MPLQLKRLASFLDAVRPPVAQRLGGVHLAIVPVTVVFGGHLALGANQPSLALGFCIAQAVACAWIVLVTQPPGLTLLERRKAGVVAGLAAAIWLLMLGATLIWAVQPWSAQVELFKMSALLLTAFAGFKLSRSVGSIRPLYKVIQAMGVAYLALSLAAYFLMPSALLGEAKFTNEARFTATFVSANAAALVCVILALISGAELTTRLSNLSQAPIGLRLRLGLTESWLSSLTLALSFTGLLLSASRAGIALGLTGLAVLVAWDYIARHKVLRGSSRRLILVAGLLIFCALLGALVLESRASDATQSAQFRQMIWSAHWEAIIQRPWLGYGPGSFEALNRRLTNGANFDLFTTIGAMHNVVLQWLEQTGLIGLLLISSLLMAITLQIWRGLDSPNANELRALIVVSLCVLAHGLVDYGLEIPSIAAHWALMLGAGLGVSLAAVDGPRAAKAMVKSARPRPRKATRL